MPRRRGICDDTMIGQLLIESCLFNGTFLEKAYRTVGSYLHVKYTCVFSKSLL